jgi:alpha-beta hydrolase superfamily lysophospholipase
MRLPGFASPVDQYAQATREQWIAAVEREVSTLRHSHGHVCLVAHSLGGAVTISYLLDQPNGVDAAVLIAPAVEVSNARSPLLSTRAWHEFGKRTLLFTRITRSPFENDAHDPRERDYPGRMIFTPQSIAEQTFQLIDNNRGRAGRFATPLMMVLSKEDQVIDWQAAERFYQQAASPRKKLRFMADAGHTIPSDFGWDELTQDIADFCRE